MTTSLLKKAQSATVIVCLLMFLSACFSTPIHRELNREGQPLTVTIKVYKGTRAFLNAAKNPAPGLNGEATYSPNDNRCDIIIKSTGTNVVDGIFTKSIGHEVMHCLYGNYHADNPKSPPPVINKED